MRKYSSTSNYSNQNQSIKEKKIFNNYTRPYGRFFDQKYQYGGDSKIDNRGRKKKNDANYNQNYQPEQNFDRVSKIDDLGNKDLKLKQLSLSREKEFYYNDRDDDLTFKSSDRKDDSRKYH